MRHPGIWLVAAGVLVTQALAGCGASTGPAPSPWVTLAHAADTDAPRPSATLTRAPPTPSEPPDKPKAVRTPSRQPLTPSPTQTPQLPTPSHTSTPRAPTATLTPLPPPTRTPQLPTPSHTPIPTQPDIDIIVDNADPGFSSLGWWYTGDGGQSYAGDCAWAPRGIQNIATLDPGLPLAGSYEVFGWWCGDPNHDQSQRARIQIYPTQGRVATYSVHVNLQADAGRWNSLGVYPLELDAFVTVDGGLDGNVVADAFRFVYRSPERVVITPTPLPTSVPWTGHPPTPLEQLTAGDLGARLGIVQRFYPHTPVTATQQRAFDDCTAFPREGCGGVREGWRVEVRYQALVVVYRVSADYHHVALESPEALAGRQTLYLLGTLGDDLFRVDRYTDDTWHLSGSVDGGSRATHWQLDAATLDRLRPLVDAYSTVSMQSPEGLALGLYGLGERVAPSSADRVQLAALGADLAAGAGGGGGGP
jgi:hypothetical protein